MEHHGPKANDKPVGRVATDPTCRFAEADVDHVCHRNTGAPIHSGETCWLEARAQLFDDEDTRHHPAPVGDVQLISTHVLAQLAELGLRTGMRTVEEQAELVKVCMLLDHDLVAYDLVDWTSRAMRTWKAKPCQGCETPTVLRQLAIDGPDRCDGCLRAEMEDITSETVAS